MTSPQYPYDLAVAYRVYPRLARGADAFGMTKYDLAALCLRSFRGCLGPVRARVWALLDGCPEMYEKLFRDLFPEQDLEIVRFEGAGNARTFLAQLEILTGQKDAPLVYLAEDDYLYRPLTMPAMVDFLSAHTDVDFVSPYDHPDYHRLLLTRPRFAVKAQGASHWRTAGTTCLTFLTRRELLEDTRTLFGTYARRNYDASVWLALTKHRVFNPVTITRLFFRSQAERMTIAKAWMFGWRQILFGPTRCLWTPVPSIATHLDAGGLARGVDWHACGLPAGPAKISQERK